MAEKTILDIVKDILKKGAVRPPFCFYVVSTTPTGERMPLIAVVTDRREDVPREDNPIVGVGVYGVYTRYGVVAPVVLQVFSTGFWCETIVNPYTDEGKEFIRLLADLQKLAVVFIVAEREGKPSIAKSILVHTALDRSVLEQIIALAKKVPLIDFEKAKKEYFRLVPA